MNDYAALWILAGATILAIAAINELDPSYTHWSTAVAAVLILVSTGAWHVFFKENDAR